MKVTNNGSFPWRGTAVGEALEKARGGGGGAGAEGGLREARDRVARQAVTAQAEAGCDLVTDGLARRDEAISEVAARLQGVEAGPEKTAASGARFRVPVIRGEVAWKEPLLVEDYLFAAAGTEAKVKVVLTGPFTIAQRAEDHAYDDPMALAMALATALNQELRALQAAGCPFVQIDEPDLLAQAEAFPIFTRVWEVLGRGVGLTLAIHLEGGDIAPVAAGLGRLKRLGCLSVDCVSHPDNLEAAAAAPLHEGALLSLGVLGARGDAADPKALVDRLRAAPGLPASARLLIGPAADLGALSFREAGERLAWLAKVRDRFDA